MLKKSKVKILLLLVIWILVLASCNNENVVDIYSEDMFYTFTDALDNFVILHEKPDKVIALTGSYAEIWILSGGKLIGVTDDVISERKINISSDTKIIGTIKDPNLEEILYLEPDFVLLSPDMESHIKISETLKKAKITYAFFKVEQFEDYLQMINICTDITMSKELYKANGLLVKDQVDDVLAAIDSKIHPSVLFIRAFSSGAKAKDDDNMTGKILKDLGTINIVTKHKSLLEDLSIEEIIEEDPDYIFVTTMGDSEKAMEAMKSGIEKHPAWSSLSAVKDDRYILLPKELFHYKPNARWGESYEYLAKIIYPEIFK